MFADRYVTADFSGAPTKWQVFTPPEDIAVKAIRSWFVFYNDPVFTDIEMRIYSYKSTVRQLLYSSDVNRAKADILTTNDYAHKDIFTTFSQTPFLKGGDSYALVPWINGYTGDESSHVAWTKNFSELVYEHSVTLDGVTDLYAAPYYFTLIGAKIL